MKAVIVPSPGVMEIREIPDPEPGPYDCLVKIDACAICSGTDASIVKGSFPWLSPYPFILGHESTGIIMETGQKVENFKPGQRVTRPMGILAGTIANGISSTWGGYAEYGLIRDVQAAIRDGLQLDGMLSASRSPLPPDVDPVFAALSINQREILSVVRKISFGENSRLLVIGSGYNGLLFSLFGKAFGASRIAVIGNARLSHLATSRYSADAYVNYRQVNAFQACLDSLGGTPTHIIDAIGSLASVKMARDIASPDTAYGCYGINEFEATTQLRSEMAQAHRNLDMGTDEGGCVREWHRLFKEGFFQQPGIYDYTMPLREIHTAFERIAKREAVKIVITMEA